MAQLQVRRAAVPVAPGRSGQCQQDAHSLGHRAGNLTPPGLCCCTQTPTSSLLGMALACGSCCSCCCCSCCSCCCFATLLAALADNCWRHDGSLTRACVLQFHKCAPTAQTCSLTPGTEPLSAACCFLSGTQQGCICTLPAMLLPNQQHEQQRSALRVQFCAHSHGT